MGCQRAQAIKRCRTFIIPSLKENNRSDRDSEPASDFGNLKPWRWVRRPSSWPFSFWWLYERVITRSTRGDAEGERYWLRVGCLALSVGR